MEDEVSGPVILISKFNVEPKDVHHFLKIWEDICKSTRPIRILMIYFITR